MGEFVPDMATDSEVVTVSVIVPEVYVPLVPVTEVMVGKAPCCTMALLSAKLVIGADTRLYWLVVPVPPNPFSIFT